jgi:hypothetical protein
MAYDPTLSREQTIIATETVAIEDAGLRYEVDFLTVRNSPFNINNGAREINHHVEAYRLKANGERGLRLKGINKRLREVAQAARAVAA